MKGLSFFIVLALVVVAAAPMFAQAATSDDRIHDEVMRRLANDRDVKGGGIEVEVSSGVVTLRGKVREAKQVERAEHLTRKVKGVKQVVNELKVDIGGGEPQAAPAQP
jgi:osmotically-inducible protein OsmY